YMGGGFPVQGATLQYIPGTCKGLVRGVLDREAPAHARAASDPLSAPRPTEDGPEPRPPAQPPPHRPADARHSAIARGELPENGGARPQVVVTADYDTLCNRTRAKHGAGMLDNSTQISPETVRRLACDAEVIPIVLNGTNQVLNVGRERRSINGGMR